MNGGKMLTCNESNSIRHCNDSLAGEHLVRDHRIFAKFPLPDHKGSNEEHTDDKQSDNEAALPGVRVASSLKCDETVPEC